MNGHSDSSWMAKTILCRRPPGVTMASARPDPNTIKVEAKNASAVIGKATYAVSDDGATLTATVSGTDAEQRPFQTVLVWERE